jgi:hypothetical protein
VWLQEGNHRVPDQDADFLAQELAVVNLPSGEEGRLEGFNRLNALGDEKSLGLLGGQTAAGDFIGGVEGEVGQRLQPGADVRLDLNSVSRSE